MAHCPSRRSFLVTFSSAFLKKGKPVQVKSESRCVWRLRSEPGCVYVRAGVLYSNATNDGSTGTPSSSIIIMHAGVAGAVVLHLSTTQLPHRLYRETWVPPHLCSMKREVSTNTVD